MIVFIVINRMIFLSFLSLVGQPSGKILILHNRVICRHHELAIQHNNDSIVGIIAITTLEPQWKSDIDDVTNKHYKHQHSLSNFEFPVDICMIHKTK